MSAPDSSATGGASEAPSSLWSGAAASPGSEIAPAALLFGAVLAVPAILLGSLLFALLPAVSWWLGALLGLVVVAGLIWWVAERADHSVLSSLSAAVPEARHPVRLVNMVEGLTLAGGVISPSVLVLEDPARNAMAVRRRDRNHLVLTTGLVDALDVVEMEATVAELLTRLRNGDAETATLGAALVGRPLIDGPLGALLAPLGRKVLGRLLPPDRDLEADRQAVTLTRYPPGLIQALQTLDGQEVQPRCATVGTASLWLVDPAPQAATAGEEDRAPLSLRIDALAEL
ncbi:MAG: hypothetical protein AAFO29_18835 [Actinomycetota bacterium]